MKTIYSSLVIAAIFISVSFTFTQPVTWKLKDDYSIKCAEISFRGLKSIILFDEAYPEKSKITATIDATTASGGNDEKTAHVKGADMLNTAKFPLISLVLTSIKRAAGESEYEAKGNLTLKGITKEIVMKFTFNSKRDITSKFPFVLKETFYGLFNINAKDFNINSLASSLPMTVELVLPVTK